MIDKTTQLIAELMKSRSAYNDVYFKLQKEKEFSNARLRDHTHSVAALKKKENELRAQRNENQRLKDELKSLQNNNIALQNVFKTERAGLLKNNALLQARINQLQFGAAEKRNIENQQHCSDRGKDLMPENDEFEVENIVDDEFRKGKQYFLVKWKGFDESENSWEAKSNLNCPKILKKYFKSK